MNTNEFMELVERGEAITGGTEAHELLLQYSNEAMRITAELTDRTTNRMKFARCFPV